MKKKFIIITAGIMLSLISCGNNKSKEFIFENSDIEIVDSDNSIEDSIENYINEINDLNENNKIKDSVYNKRIDSLLNSNYDLTLKTDSLKAEVLFRDLKLNRIRSYVEISKRGNNIKYLRGWILRVLNEK